MTTTYKITFKTKEAIGVVLYELEAWGVSRALYEVSDTEYVLYHASADVVDVVTESLMSSRYAVEEEND